MEVLSGILLTGVILGIFGYLLREALGEQAGAIFSRYGEASPVEINDSLVGDIAQVVEFKEGAELLRVRIRGERWNANLIAGRGLPPGAEVRVIAVNGLVLDVEECVDEHASAAGATIEET
jgi:membrane-bound ClpP family serine protease